MTKLTGLLSVVMLLVIGFIMKVNFTQELTLFFWFEVMVVSTLITLFSLAAIKEYDK